MRFFGLISILKTDASSLSKHEEPIETVCSQPMQLDKVVFRETNAVLSAPRNSGIKT